jgi:hypothetical protein
MLATTSPIPTLQQNENRSVRLESKAAAAKLGVRRHR